MATSGIKPPVGFTLDAPTPPSGFQLDSSARPEPEDTWEYVFSQGGRIAETIPAPARPAYDALFQTAADPQEFEARMAESLFLASTLQLPIDVAWDADKQLARHLFGRPMTPSQVVSLAMRNEDLIQRAVDVWNSNALYRKAAQVRIGPKTAGEDVLTAMIETPTNMKVGLWNIPKMFADAVKRRAMIYSGGGVFPDESLRHQYEAVPAPVSQFRKGKPFEQDPDVLPRHIHVPGAIAAEAAGVVTRMPDVASQVIDEQQMRLQRDQAAIDAAPITQIMRATWQSGVPSIAVSISSAVLTGNPQVGLAMFYEITAGQTFDSLRKEGLNITEAGLVSSVCGAAEVAGEMLVFPKFIKGLKEGIPLASALVLVAENAGQEGVTGFTQGFTEKLAVELKKGRSLREAIGAAYEEGESQAIEGAVVGGLTAGMMDAATLPATIHQTVKERRMLAQEQVRALRFAAAQGELTEEIVSELEQQAAQAESEAQGEQEAKPAAPAAPDAVQPESAAPGMAEKAGREPSQDVQVKGPDVQVTPTKAQPAAEETPSQEVTEAPIESEKAPVRPVEAITPEEAAVGPVAEAAGPTPEYKKIRKTELAKITRAIKTSDAYQVAAEGRETQGFSATGLGSVYIPEKYKGDIEAYAGEKGKKGYNKRLWAMISHDKKGGQHWDDAAQELGWPDDFDGFMERLALYAEGDVAPDIMDVAESSRDPELETLAIKRDMLLANEPIAKINAEIQANLIDGHESYGMTLLDAEVLAAKLKIGGAGGEISVGAASLNWKSRRRAIERAEKQAKKTGGKRYVIQQQGGRFMVKTEPPKRGNYTLVDLSLPLADQITYIKQASPTIEKAFDYGEQPKQRTRLMSALQKFKRKAKAAKADAKSIRDELYHVIRTLPAEHQGQMLPIFKALSPTSRQTTDLKNLMKAIAKTEDILRAADQKRAVAELKKTIATIKKKWGSRQGEAFKMRPDLRAPAEKLMQSFEIANIKPEKAIERQQLLDMAKTVVETSKDDAAIHATAVKMVADLTAKKAETIGIKIMPAESLDAVTDMLKWAVHEQEWGERAVLSMNRQKLDTIRETILEAVVARPDRGPIGTFIHEKHANMETLSTAITGGSTAYSYDEWIKAENPLTESVYEVINRGVGKEIVARETINAKITEILKESELSLKELKGIEKNRVVIVADGVRHEVRPDELMSIYMHTRHAYNLDVLLKHGIRDEERIIKPKAEDIGPMLEKLTAKQELICERIGVEVLDGLMKDYLNKTGNLIEGHDVAREDNYWGAGRYIQETAKGKSTKAAKLDAPGFLRERVGGTDPLRLKGFFEKLSRQDVLVSAYYGMAPAVRDARMIVNDPELIAAMEEAGQLPVLRAIQTQIERVEDNSKDYDNFERCYTKIDTLATKGIFSLNPKIAPRQELSYQMIVPYVDARAFAAGLAPGGTGIFKETIADSPEIRDRVRNNRFDRDLGAAATIYKPERMFFGKGPLTDIGLKPVQYFDARAIKRIVKAAHWEVANANPDMDPASQKFRDLRVRRVEFLVRKTQPTYHPKDRSLIGSSPKTLTHSFTKFMSQREKIVMMATDAHNAYVNGRIGARKYAQVMGSIAANIALITAYNVAFWSLLYKEKPDIELIVKEFIGNTVGLVFFGNYIMEVARNVEKLIEGKGFYGVLFETLPLRFAQAVAEGVSYTSAGAIMLMTGNDDTFQSGPREDQRKAYAYMWQGITSIALAFAMVKGVPYVSARYAKKMLENWGVIGDEEEDEYTPIYQRESD